MALPGSTDCRAARSRSIGVAYGGGAFVAVGNGGIAYRSTDGASWSSVTTGLTDTLIYVAYGAGVFSAVGSTGNIFTSPEWHRLDAEVYRRQCAEFRAVCQRAVQSRWGQQHGADLA